MLKTNCERDTMDMEGRAILPLMESQKIYIIAVDRAEVGKDNEYVRWF